MERPKLSKPKNIGKATGTEAMAKSRSLDDTLKGRLQNPEFVSHYLSAAWEEGNDAFLVALKRMI
jgi:DNA-binding phage protein